MNRSIPADRDFFDRLPYDDDYPDLYPEDDREQVSCTTAEQAFGSLRELRRRFGDADDRDDHRDYY